jgi:type II secretory pathway pseudopilin PulG
MLFSSQKGLAKMLSLSADSGVESLNKHKFALQNQAKNTTFKNFIQSTRNVRSVGQMRRKFLTTCTIKGTRGGNLQADVPQYGRSMIEMLGVLAIIGVLSVGGIAGYSKAMTKFKINKTIEQVSQIAANARTLFKSQDDYSGLDCVREYVDICKKAKIVPDDVFDANGKMKNPFGGDIIIEPFDDSFHIWYFDVPEDACMELSTIDWGSATSDGLNAVSINADSGGAHRKNCDGTDDTSGYVACVDDPNANLPIEVGTAATYCSGNNNRLGWGFY